MISNKKGIIALSPLIVFIVLYLVTSIIAQDFYKIPIVIAFLVSSIYAITITPHHSLSQRIDIFSHGAGSKKILLMIWIFILAGAFANTAKAMGSIDAIVNLALYILPSNMLFAGLFLAACFISLAIGTSVGTIVALVPIACGLAHFTGVSLPLVTGIVVGGSFFGDNLSFISDTTVVATHTQGCKMSDKFKVNSFIVFPAAILILLVYIVMGLQTQSAAEVTNINLLKVVPYIAVLVTAILGLHVLLVLFIGIILSAGIGFLDGSYNIFGCLKTMNDGILNMGELIVITMLAGGLLEMIRRNGGIHYMIDKLSAHIHSKRKAEFSIGLLISLVNVCTANNTVAILTVGSVTKKIGEQYGVDSRKAASILDTFSCCIQGLLPYGAQVLMASGLTGLNPIHIIPYLYYPVLTGIAALSAIMFRYPKRYS